MSNVVAFTPRRDETGRHLRCPFCGDMTAYCNIGPQQWGYCDEHRTRWYLGACLTDDWLREETVRDWIGNRHFLDGLALVYSVPPKQYTQEQA